MIVFLWLLNFGISWLNAWGAGKSWTEAKCAGGWARLLAWSTVIMSACGFTWCLSLLLGAAAPAVASWFGVVIPPSFTIWLYELTYVLVILPIIGTGLVLTLNSWAVFWRRRTLANGAVASWNTFAQISNAVDAAEAFPAIVGKLFDALSDGDNKHLVLAGIVVVLALTGGCLLTRAILLSSARAHDASMRFERAVKEW